MTNESFGCSSRHELFCVVTSAITGALDVGDNGAEVRLLYLLRPIPSLGFVCCSPMITDQGLLQGCRGLVVKALGLVF